MITEDHVHRETYDYLLDKASVLELQEEEKDKLVAHYEEVLRKLTETHKMNETWIREQVDAYEATVEKLETAHAEHEQIIESSDEEVKIMRHDYERRIEEEINLNSKLLEETLQLK